jgi:hypothetical protein
MSQEELDFDDSEAGDVCEDGSSKQGYQIAVARASVYVTEMRPMKNMLMTMMGRSLTSVRVSTIVSSFHKSGVRPDWCISVRAAWTGEGPDPWIADIMKSPAWALLSEGERNNIQFLSKGRLWIINGNHRLRAVIVLSTSGARDFHMDTLHINTVVYPENMDFVDASHLSFMINATEAATMLPLSILDRFNIIGALMHQQALKMEAKTNDDDVEALSPTTSLNQPIGSKAELSRAVVDYAKAARYNGISREVVSAFTSLDPGNGMLFPMLDLMNYLATVDATSLRKEQAVCLQPSNKRTKVSTRGRFYINQQAFTQLFRSKQHGNERQLQQTLVVGTYWHYWLVNGAPLDPSAAGQMLEDMGEAAKGYMHSDILKVWRCLQNLRGGIKEGIDETIRKCSLFLEKTLPLMWWHATGGGTALHRQALVKLVDLFNDLKLDTGDQSIDGYQTQVQKKKAEEELKAKLKEEEEIQAKLYAFADVCAKATENSEASAKKARESSASANEASAAIHRFLVPDRVKMLEHTWQSTTKNTPKIIGLQSKELHKSADPEAPPNLADQYSIATLCSEKPIQRVSEFMHQKAPKAWIYEMFGSSAEAETHYRYRRILTAVRNKVGRKDNDAVRSDMSANSIKGMWEFAENVAMALVGRQLPLVYVRYIYRPAGTAGMPHVDEEISNYSVLFVLSGELELVFRTMVPDGASCDVIQGLGATSGPVVIPSNQLHFTRGRDAENDKDGYDKGVVMMVLSFASSKLDDLRSEARHSGEAASMEDDEATDDVENAVEDALGGSSEDDEGDGEDDGDDKPKPDKPKQPKKRQTQLKAKAPGRTNHGQFKKNNEATDVEEEPVTPRKKRQKARANKQKGRATKKKQEGKAPKKAKPTEKDDPIFHSEEEEEEDEEDEEEEEEEDEEEEARTPRKTRQQARHKKKANASPSAAEVEQTEGDVLWQDLNRPEGGKSPVGGKSSSKRKTTSSNNSPGPTLTRGSKLKMAWCHSIAEFEPTTNHCMDNLAAIETVMEDGDADVVTHQTQKKFLKGWSNEERCQTQVNILALGDARNVRGDTRYPASVRQIANDDDVLILVGVDLHDPIVTGLFISRMWTRVQLVTFAHELKNGEFEIVPCILALAKRFPKRGASPKEEDMELQVPHLGDSWDSVKKVSNNHVLVQGQQCSVYGFIELATLTNSVMQSLLTGFDFDCVGGGGGEVAALVALPGQYTAIMAASLVGIALEIRSCYLSLVGQVGGRNPLDECRALANQAWQVKKKWESFCGGMLADFKSDPPNGHPVTVGWFEVFAALLVDKHLGCFAPLEEWQHRSLWSGKPGPGSATTVSELSKSNIHIVHVRFPNGTSGKGLSAKENIPAGLTTLVFSGYFQGATSQRFVTPYHSQNILMTGDGFIGHGKNQILIPNPRELLYLINEGDDTTKANVAFEVIHPDPAQTDVCAYTLRILRDIKQGEQLRVQYRNQYWEDKRSPANTWMLENKKIVWELFNVFYELRKDAGGCGEVVVLEPQHALAANSPGTYIEGLLRPRIANALEAVETTVYGHKDQAYAKYITRTRINVTRAEITKLLGAAVGEVFLCVIEMELSYLTHKVINLVRLDSFGDYGPHVLLAEKEPQTNHLDSCVGEVHSVALRLTTSGDTGFAAVDTAGDEIAQRYHNMSQEGDKDCRASMIAEAMVFASKALKDFHPEPERLLPPYSFVLFTNHIHFGRGTAEGESRRTLYAEAKIIGQDSKYPISDQSSEDPYHAEFFPLNAVGAKEVLGTLRRAYPQVDLPTVGAVTKKLKAHKA